MGARVLKKIVLVRYIIFFTGRGVVQGLFFLFLSLIKVGTETIDILNSSGCSISVISGSYAVEDVGTPCSRLLTPRLKKKILTGYSSRDKNTIGGTRKVFEKSSTKKERYLILYTICSCYRGFVVE